MNEVLLNKKILITGSSGYLGSALVDTLKKLNCEIRTISRDHLSSTEAFEQTLPGVDIVYHLAGQTSTYKANENPSLDIESNLIPMLNILQTCQKQKSPPFVVFTGAATQVGLPKEVRVDESFPDQPVTVYDLHKLFAENYLKYYTRHGFARGTTLRLANVFGPGPRSSSADRGIVNLMVQRALKGVSLTLYGDGQYVRDYVFIDDVVNALLAAATHQTNCSGKHFLIGSGVGRTIADALKTVADVVKEKTHRDVIIEKIPSPASQSPIEYRNFEANITGFQTATGWIPKVSFQDGIQKTVEYWQKELQLK